MNGKILNNNNVEGVYVFNINTKKTTISDSTGYFSILVKENDTLSFRSLVYQPKKIVISTDNIGYLEIMLEKKVYSLAEVTLGRWDFLYSFPNSDFETNENSIISLQGKPRSSLVHFDKTITGLSVNLEALYNRLSGINKKTKQRKKWELQDDIIKALIDRFSIAFFNNAFGIEKNNIYEFLLFSIENTALKEAVLKKKNYLILKNLEKASLDYRKE